MVQKVCEHHEWIQCTQTITGGEAFTFMSCKKCGERLNAELRTNRRTGETVVFPIKDKSEKLYNQLKHIYDSYSDEWTFHNKEETAKILHDYETN